jgi:hypothetical protein
MKKSLGVPAWQNLHSNSLISSVCRLRLLLKTSYIHSSYILTRKSACPDCISALRGFWFSVTTLQNAHPIGWPGGKFKARIPAGVPLIWPVSLKKQTG